MSSLPYHPDILLEYLTELGSGSWSRFRDAHAACRIALCLRSTWVGRGLASLGHLELEPETLDWAVCPTSVVELPDEERLTGIVCGARSPGFLARLIEAVTMLGGDVQLRDRWDESEDFVLRPIFYLRSRADFAELATYLDVRFLPDAARRLASVLPTIDALINACPREPAPPSSPLLERLDAGFHWRRTGRGEEPGLYRLQSIPFDRFWLVTRQGCWKVPYPIGLYGSRHDLLRYDRDSRCVSFAAQARPPDLHLRALTICSGEFARLAMAYRLVLSDVPPDVFVSVARSLRQEGIA